MNSIASAVIVAIGLFLIGLAAVVFMKPLLGERFFMAFASSARTHYLEQAFRLLLGSSLVVLSPAMWQSGTFLFLGWIIVISTIGLMLIPWQWHHRFGQLVLPILVRHMRLYAVGLFAFGALLLYGVFASGFSGAT